MAFLDFIRNRQASQQQGAAEKTQQQKPETAKEMYAREAKQEEDSRKPLEQMLPEQKAQAAAIKARLEKATEFHQPAATAKSPSPSDGSGSPEVMRQKAMNQDKSAPEQSPTSAQAGATAIEKNTPARSGPSETPSKSPQVSNTRPQTLPRPRPSWER